MWLYLWPLGRTAVTRPAHPLPLEWCLCHHQYSGLWMVSSLPMPKVKLFLQSDCMGKQGFWVNNLMLKKIIGSVLFKKRERHRLLCPHVHREGLSENTTGSKPWIRSCQKTALASWPSSAQSHEDIGIFHLGLWALYTLWWHVLSNWAWPVSSCLNSSSRLICIWKDFSLLKPGQGAKFIDHPYLP